MFDKLKQRLESDLNDRDGPHYYKDGSRSNALDTYLIVHNKDKIGFQFCGHCVWLNSDGTYFWDEDTSGG